MKSQKELCKLNLEMQIILLGDKLRKANHIISRVIDRKYTEPEAQQMLKDAQKLVAEVQQALIG